MLCFELKAAFAAERDAAGMLAKFREYTPMLVQQPQGRWRLLIPAGIRIDAMRRHLAREFPLFDWTLIEMSEEGFITEIVNRSVDL
jgi:hypothetical protein